MLRPRTVLELLLWLLIARDLHIFDQFSMERTSMKEFVRLVQWPAIFTAVALLTNDKCWTTIVVLALVFQPDLSAVLRTRRLTIGWPGFQGRIGGDRVPPPRRKKQPPG
jgi:hypothetical protein